MSTAIGLLRSGLMVNKCLSLSVAVLIAGCGGGGGGSGASSTSMGGTNTTTTLFSQPQETGIAGNLVVPLATHTAPPAGTFVLVVEQTNPSTTNGELVPTGWSASSQTGFAPSDPMNDQLGFQNVAGTSTAQMDGATVGAYINSKDVPTSTVDPGGMNGGCGHIANPPVQNMMIAPQYVWPSGAEPAPFASSAAVLNGSLDLQIPTASGEAYATVDLLFEDVNGVRITYGIVLFHNGGASPAVGCGYNAPANTFKIDSPLGVDQRFVSLASGSTSYVVVPWLGMKHFEWSISQSQFTAALNFLAPQFPGKVQDLNPANYKLIQMHLNAEVNFLPGPADLGWSMTGLNLWVDN